MSSAAPKSPRRVPRPPASTDAAPSLGAAEPYPILRRTAARRPLIAPRPWTDPVGVLGFPSTHPYVRRYWTPVVGPGAVADLLRLATAAARGRSLARPVHLHVLTREGLVRHDARGIWVRTTIPPLAARHIRRLPPALRREHLRERWDRPHRPGAD